jgi:butyrate kinase
MGPFSTNRAGALPIGPLVKMCYSGAYTEVEMVKKLSEESGLIAYLGTTDLRQILKMIEDGDRNAKLILDALIYQVAKEAGACAAALKGKVDAMVLTGGFAFADYVHHQLKEYLGFIAPLVHLPGEFEMEALANGVYRVLDGLESVKIYE